MRPNPSITWLAILFTGASWLPAFGQTTPRTPAPAAATPPPKPASPAPAMPAATATPATKPAAPPISPQELEQLVAPVALYPDSLLSQILMASTYPLEVVQADRFAKANPKLTGDALTAQLEKQDWDASVKSLVNFPTVLAVMSEKLDSTIKLGDAFLEDQQGVMEAVQRLRNKAQSQGNLQTTKEQTVVVEKAPETQTQVIRIESPNPQVVYVPTYNPTVVYGSWPYPAYPPTPWYPPGYVATGVISFGLGVAAGAAWGYAWGGCDWGNNDVNVDVNRNANINTNIDRSKYQNQINNRQTNRTNGANTRQNSFQHDPAHRQGVAYRDQNTSQRFGGANQQAIQSRDAYRGRAEAGRQDISRGSANGFSGPNAATPNRSDLGASNRVNQGTAANRASPSAGAANRSSAPSSGLSGVGGGGRTTQSASQRGNASRSSSAGARSSGGAARSSGGARAGGGGRGGGGRR